MEFPHDKSLILFDGYCHLCSGLVQRIIRRDRKAYFLFAPINSPTGQYWRNYYQIPDSVDSIVLIEGDQFYLYSDAVLRIAGRLGGWHRIFKLGYVVPRSWRNSLYRLVARRRFDWFGRRHTCFLPDESVKNRFL